MDKPQKKQLVVLVDVDIKDQLALIAREKDRSMTYIVNDILKNVLAAKRKKKEVKPTHRP